jgi:hypothetical protein
MPHPQSTNQHWQHSEWPKHRGCVKYWEIITDNLKKAGWSLGWISAMDCNGQTIWIADAHRGDGQRFGVRADGKLRAFVELQAAIPSSTRIVTKADRARPPDAQLSALALHLPTPRATG